MSSDFATPAQPAAFSSDVDPDQTDAPDASDNPDQNAPAQGGQDNEKPAQEDPKSGETDVPEDGGAPAEPPVEPPPVEPPPEEPPSYVDEHTATGANSIALTMPFLKIQASVSNEFVIGETISIVVGNKTDMAAGAKFLYTAAPLEVKVNVGFNVVSDRSKLLRRLNNENQTTVGGICIARKNREYKDLCRRIKTAGKDMKRTESQLQIYATRQEVEAIRDDIRATMERLDGECTEAVAALDTVAARSTRLAGKCEETVGVANTLAENIETACAEAERTAAASTQSNAVGSALAAQITSSPLATMIN